MRSGSKATWVLAITCAMMLAIVASACGGATPSAQATAKPAAASVAATSAAPAAPTVAPKPATVRFGLASYNWLWVPYMVGEGLGIFKKHNLDVQTGISSTSTALQAGVVGGTYDIGAVATDALVFLSAKQTGVVSLAYSGVNGNPYTLIANPAITTLQGLRGKSIITSATATADGFAAQEIMRTVGMKEGDYSFLVSVGGPAGRAAALIAKQGDAVLVYGPEIATLQAAGFRELGKGIDIPLMRDMSSFAVVINNQWAKANRATVVTLLKAWTEAANAVYDPAKKSAVVATLVTQMKIPEAVISAALDHSIAAGFWNKSCKVEPVQLQSIVQVGIDSKTIDAPGPKPADMILDPTYCADALK